MIPDILLDRHSTAAPYNCARWSNDGRLAITCASSKHAGSGLNNTGIEILTPVVAREWTVNGQPTHKVEYKSSITWLDIDSTAFWINATKNDFNNETESISEGQSIISITDLAWSPIRTSIRGGPLLAVLLSTLEVIIFVSSKNEKSSSTDRWKQLFKLNLAVAKSLNISINNNDKQQLLIEEKEKVQRLRIHSIAWSDAFYGLQDSQGRTLSILATGHEDGSIYLWRIYEEVGAGITGSQKISEGWITNIKFSAVIGVENPQEETRTCFMLISTSINELFFCPMIISNSSVSLGVPQLVKKKSKKAISHLNWARSLPENGLIGVATMVNHAIVVNVVVVNSDFTVNVHEERTGLIVPIVGSNFNAIPDGILITLISHTGEIKSLTYPPRALSTDASLIARKISNLLESRVKNYYSPFPDENEETTEADIRIASYDSDVFLNPFILYSILPANSYYYPVSSTDWSRIILYYSFTEETTFENLFNRYNQIKRSAVSPRTILWCAKLAAVSQKEESEIQWVIAAISYLKSLLPSDDIFQKFKANFLVDSRIGFTRRLLYSFNNWALSFSGEQALDGDARSRIIKDMYDSCRHSRVEIASLVLQIFLDMKSGCDEYSGKIAYQYARFLRLGSHKRVADFDWLTGLSRRTFEKLKQFGYPVDDELSDARLIEKNRMLDVGISGVVEESEAAVALDDTDRDKECKCIACGSDVEIRMDLDAPEEFIAVCRTNGHTWGVCSITLLPVMGLHQRRCSLCSQTAISRESITNSIGTPVHGSVLDKLLHDNVICVYCGEEFYVM
ncbi:hypothetical protein V1514DRAFT_350475 [Lipomyces japonicus]|uniref:uncharacterized protein n=1 Tax=Lipomyces japonicus TaxID=56871 RepID=UPI0034D00285